MKKCSGILAVLIVICVLFCGCGGGQEETENKSGSTESENADAVKIGLSFDSFVIERWLRDRDAFVPTARELGAEVNVQNANGSVKEQISQIEYLIEKDVDVLVVVAVDCNALTEVVAKAHKAGIPVISYDRLIRDAGTDLYVSFDNRAVGSLMAENLKAAIPSGGEIFMIQGPEEDNNVRLVREGFEEGLKGGNLEAVYKANCEGWLAEQAAEYLDEALEEYPDVKGIMCGNDDIASQVVRVLSENRMAGKVQVVGQDGDLAACQRIVEGTQTMTAFKSVEILAKAAAEYAVKMAKGEELDRVNSSISDGSKEIPFCMLQPIAVTKKNMDEIIIEGGFHSEEDVYLNVPRN
ncbi:MAG: substrate-binding domain-containing protein [Eubacteriales bacterium]|nr:substrate-binding domain-containing protein [Eubacteriales bacterium]